MTNNQTKEPVPIDLMSQRYIDDLKKNAVGATIKAITVNNHLDGYRGENVCIRLSNDVEIIINGYISFNA